MPRRIARTAASGLSDVVAILDGVEDQVTVVFDIDGTIVPQGSLPDDCARAVVSAIETLEGHPMVERAIPLSNGADRGVAGVVGHGNKPWTARRRLGLTRDDTVVVVGDQVLTDGVLAWRLGGTFIHLVVDDWDEPPDQSQMRRRGRLLEPFLFKPGRR